MENLRYPVGRFTWPKEVSEVEITNAIEVISKFPSAVEETVQNFSSPQLDTPYRPEGWTVRQLIHHCADSHMNAYIRFKLALTETEPTIKPYQQARWAELADSALDHQISISLLKATHTRWVTIMQAMNAADWERAFIHPEHQQKLLLKQFVMMYAWHCRHHLHHIIRLKERMEWA